MQFKEMPGYAQLVLSERTVNCAMEALVKSKLSTINLSTDFLQQQLEFSNVNIDVSTISQFIKEFEE